MLTPRQIELLELFHRYPLEEHSFAQIKRFSKETSNSFLQNAIAQFLKERILSRKKVVNAYVYRACLNDLTLSYFGLLANEKLPEVARKSLEIIKQELRKLPFYTLLVFGSYACGEQKPTSDLDVAVIVPQGKNAYEQTLRSAATKTPLELDYHLFTQEELQQMIENSHENLGKELLRKHIAVHNPSILYNILNESKTILGESRK